MIPIALSPKLLEVKHAAYCTTVSLPSQGAHNLHTDSHRDTSQPHAEAHVSWALSFLMPSADVSHARPLRAVQSDDPKAKRWW
jgi:hypothetical protein